MRETAVTSTDDCVLRRLAVIASGVTLAAATGVLGWAIVVAHL